MNAYAIAFLKARIREGSDPDYFSIPGYTVNINQAVDRFAGDAALTIMIYK